MVTLLMLYAVLVKWFDSATTYILVTRRGKRCEFNPLMRWLMYKIGTAQALALAMGLWCAVMYPMVISLLYGMSFSYVILNGFLTAVVLNNFYQLRRAGISIKDIFKDM